jgi:hypothetical protein
MDSVLHAIGPWSQRDGTTAVKTPEDDFQSVRDTVDMTDNMLLSPVYEIATDAGCRSAINEFDFNLSNSLLELMFPNKGTAVYLYMCVYCTLFLILYDYCYHRMPKMIFLLQSCYQSHLPPVFSLTAGITQSMRLNLRDLMAMSIYSPTLLVKQ